MLEPAVKALKYGSVRTLATPLGRRLGEAVQAQGWRPDLVVPVPLHPARLRDRGFNQAELLARQVAQVLARPLEKPLQRVRETPSQTRLSGQRRIANVQGAFQCSRLLTGAVLLVDDVTTTGATAHACARALLAAGARQVQLAVLCRARP
ncbi:MAG: ComF family protein [Deinococcus sp.]|nr:ComF family protein [Deinococcus sp.]